MPKPKNAMEIFKWLDKSNCGECGEKTCLAFAGAVFTGQRRLDRCPKMDHGVLARFSTGIDHTTSPEGEGENALARLKQEIAAGDLAAAAMRLGGRFSGDRLTLAILGKRFSVDSAGNLSAEIHINPWVAVPFLSHVLYGKGLRPAGNWVGFRALAGGRERYALFQKRCEEPMKQVADRYPGLFDDMVHLFSGQEVEKQFKSDISVVLWPLPRVPLMICYWLPEDGLRSGLHVFFDRTVEQNLDIGSIFTLGAGLAQMFERIALRHGVREERFGV